MEALNIKVQYETGEHIGGSISPEHPLTAAALAC